MKWAVLLNESNGNYAYGPWADEEKDVADGFAAYLTREVDPARVVPADEVGPDVTWSSPVAELLSWHDNVRSQGVLQAGTDPTSTGHLRAGERITLDELAVHLSALAVWTRQLSVAAETPAVPVELRDLCEQLDRMADQLTDQAGTVADVDRIITDQAPLAPFFNGREPWGARAAETEPGQYHKRLSTVLTPRQIRHLAEWQRATGLLGARPARPQRQLPKSPAEADGIPYLDGLAGLPGLDAWESARAGERRARDRAAAIAEQTLRETCESCNAGPGEHCRTKTGRLAEQSHQPRIRTATAVIDAREDIR